MFQKIENKLYISISGADLTNATNIRFYIKQNETKLELQPTVLTSNSLYVVVPYSSAMLFAKGTADCQLCFTDANSNKFATDITKIDVKELIAEGGYNVT